VGRTSILDGSIEQKNKRAEIHTYGKNRWVNRLNKGKNWCHCYTLLQFQQREEDETEDSERRKKKETIKNSSNLMLKIETAIKDSRFFCSSALLCNWEWNGFDKFLKLIRSSSHFSALQCIRDSSICSCRFGHENIKKKNPCLSRVWPGRPGPWLTLRVDRVWPGQFPACFWLRPGPATGPGRPGPESTHRAGPGLKTLLHRSQCNLSIYSITNSNIFFVIFF